MQIVIKYSLGVKSKHKQNMGSTESATKRVTVEREEDNIKVRLSCIFSTFR